MAGEGGCHQRKSEPVTMKRICRALVLVVGFPFMLIGGMLIGMAGVLTTLRDGWRHFVETGEWPMDFENH